MAMLTSAIFTTLLTIASPYQGVCYRCVQPRFANVRDAISGGGSAKASGRYHLKGAFPIVYTSCTLEQAQWEYFSTSRNAGFPVSDLLPVTLLAIDVLLDVVLDLNRTEVLSLLGLTTVDLFQFWVAEDESLTQRIGRLASETGFEGILVPTQNGGVNLNVFPANVRPESLFVLRNSERLI